jgi:hypothetical protein
MSDEHRLSRALPIAGESNTEYRKRLDDLRREKAAHRQRELDEQSSPLNSPSVRIRAWERLHQLDLPGNPKHHLVHVIAANTGLTVDEVLAEQASRSAAPE